MTIACSGASTRWECIGGVAKACLVMLKARARQVYSPVVSNLPEQLLYLRRANKSPYDEQNRPASPEASGG